MSIKNYECEGQLSIFDIQEPVYELDIVGICDDPVCPKCGYEFETTRTCKNYEVDCERCPECHVKVNWRRWHKANDEETADDKGIYSNP